MADKGTPKKANTQTPAPADPTPQPKPAAAKAPTPEPSSDPNVEIVSPTLKLFATHMLALR